MYPLSVLPGYTGPGKVICWIVLFWIRRGFLGWGPRSIRVPRGCGFGWSRIRLRRRDRCWLSIRKDLVPSMRKPTTIWKYSAWPSSCPPHSSITVWAVSTRMPYRPSAWSSTWWAASTRITPPIVHSSSGWCVISPSSWSMTRVKQSPHNSIYKWPLQQQQNNIRKWVSGKPSPMLSRSVIVIPW